MLIGINAVVRRGERGEYILDIITADVVDGLDEAIGMTAEMRNDEDLADLEEAERTYRELLDFARRGVPVRWTLVQS